jgi:hypothetical protein
LLTDTQSHKLDLHAFTNISLILLHEEREIEKDFFIIILHQHTWYAAPGSEESILLANPQDQTLCRNVNPIWVIEKKKVFKETYLNLV